VITPLLPIFQRGTLDAAAGTIDNLSGAALLASNIGRAIGDAGAERFALLHFRGLSPVVDSPISLSEGKSSIVSVPTATFVASQFDFARPLITVVEPSTPAEAEAHFYQGLQGAPAVEVAGGALHNDCSFYVEISIADANAADGDGPSNAALHAAAENVVASLPGDRAPGDLFLSRIQIHSSAGAVDLPLAAIAVDESPALPAATTRIGLTYLPRAAADAVSAAADCDDAAPEAAVDDSLMQALASGLAFADQSDLDDPFQIHFH
jgi:hypothetical protein